MLIRPRFLNPSDEGAHLHLMPPEEAPPGLVPERL